MKITTPMTALLWATAVLANATDAAPPAETAMPERPTVEDTNSRLLDEAKLRYDLLAPGPNLFGQDVNAASTAPTRQARQQQRRERIDGVFAEIDTWLKANPQRPSMPAAKRRSDSAIEPAAIPNGAIDQQPAEKFPAESAGESSAVLMIDTSVDDAEASDVHQRDVDPVNAERPDEFYSSEDMAVPTCGLNNAEELESLADEADRVAAEIRRRLNR